MTPSPDPQWIGAVSQPYRKGRGIMSGDWGNGGSAFPRTVYSEEQPVDQCSGMSLRDWFAGQAIIGFISNAQPGGNPDPNVYARAAYRIADAMLVARNRRPEESKPTDPV